MPAILLASGQIPSLLLLLLRRIQPSVFDAQDPVTGLGKGFVVGDHQDGLVIGFAAGF